MREQAVGMNKLSIKLFHNIQTFNHFVTTKRQKQRVRVAAHLLGEDTHFLAYTGELHHVNVSQTGTQLVQGVEIPSE